jgi:hypothetical protein
MNKWKIQITIEEEVEAEYFEDADKKAVDICEHYGLVDPDIEIFPLGYIEGREEV